MNILLLISLFVLCQCDKESPYTNCSIAKITTLKTHFSKTDSIKFEIQNISNDTIFLYCPCLGDGNTPFSRLEKYENSIWRDIYSSPFRICTGNVLPEIWTPILPDRITECDISQYVYESGKYRLKCEFSYDSNTTSCYSNTFYFND